MLPDIQPGNTKILYFFNCLLDGMHTILFSESVSLPAAIRIYQNQLTYEVDTGIIQFRRLLSFLEGAVFVLKLK